MSLSCLTCQGLQRSDSDPGLDQENNKPFERLSPGVVARKRSGCLGCSPRDRIRKGSSSSFSSATPPTPPTPKGGAAPRKSLRKFATTANMEEHAAAAAAAAVVSGEQPRLVRSSGMRRDWSFEDLQKKVLVVNMHRTVQ